MPLVVLCFSSCMRNASSVAGVGAKLQCALCAEKANRNRGSTKKGIPHLITSSASGATFLRIPYSRCKCGCPSRGAARMYSAIVVGRLLAISLDSVTDLSPRTERSSSATGRFVLVRSFQYESSKDMALPHPQSRKHHYRKEDKPDKWCVLWQVFKRTINITEYRNAKDDVNPAPNRALSGITDHSILSQ